MEPLHYKNEYVTCLKCGVTYDTQTIYCNENYICEVCGNDIGEVEVKGNLYLMSDK